MLGNKTESYSKENKIFLPFCFLSIIRTMATWGSSPCHLDDDDDDEDDDEDEYQSEIGAEEEEEHEECADSSSDDDIHIYSSSRNQCSYSNRKNQGRSVEVQAEGILLG